MNQEKSKFSNSYLAKIKSARPWVIGILFCLCSQLLAKESIFQESKKSFLVKGQKYFLLTKYRDEKMFQQVLMGPDFQEIILSDTNGKTEQWEITKGNLTLRAQNPAFGVFRTLEYTRLTKRGRASIQFSYNFKNRKYIAQQASYRASQTFNSSGGLSITANESCRPDPVTEKQASSLKQLISELKLKDGQDRADALAEYLEKKKDNLFESSCWKNDFKNPENLKAINKAVAQVMSSPDNKQGKATYLRCLEENRLGIHAARIQARIYASTELDSNETRYVQFGSRLIACKGPADANDSLGYITESAQKDLNSKTSSEGKKEHAIFGNYSEDAGRLTFMQTKEAMSQQPVQSGIFGNEINEKNLGIEDRGAKNLELTFFHEMLHASGIESEKITHAIQDCCGLGLSEDSGACKSMRLLTQGELIRQSTQVFLSSATPEYNKLMDYVTTNFETATVADNFRNKFHQFFYKSYEKNRQEYLVCEEDSKKGQTRGVDCMIDFQERVKKEVKDKAKADCQSDNSDSPDEEKICTRVANLAAEVAADSFPKSACTFELPIQTDPGLEAFRTEKNFSSESLLKKLTGGPQAFMSPAKKRLEIWQVLIGFPANAEDCSESEGLKNQTVKVGIPFESPERLKTSNRVLPSEIGEAVAGPPSLEAIDRVTQIPEPSRPVGGNIAKEDGARAPASSMIPVDVLGEIGQRKDVAAKTDRSEKVFSTVTGAVKDVMNQIIPEAQAEQVMPKNRKNLINREDSRNPESKIEKISLLQAPKLNYSGAQNLQVPKEPQDRRQTPKGSSNSGELAVNSNGVSPAESSTLANPKTAQQKTAGKPGITGAGANSDPGATSNVGTGRRLPASLEEEVIEIIENQPEQALRKIKFSSFREKLIRVRIRVFDESAVAFGSKNPKWTFRYSKPEKKFLKDLGVGQ